MPKQGSLPAPVPDDGISISVQSVEVASGRTPPAPIQLPIVIANKGPRDVYVLHRPWVVDNAGRYAWDPDGVYRFVDHGSLRLLLGPSPVLANMSVNNPQFPHASLLASGGTLTLDLPLKTLGEYSLFFDDVTATKPMMVTKCEVIVQYVVLEEGVTVKPSNIDPTAFAVSTGRSRLRAAYGASVMTPTELQRREGVVARPVLPTD